jgi:hypothetical protein
MNNKKKERDEMRQAILNDRFRFCNPEFWHEAAKLFPLMDAAELDALANDISTNGIHNPVVMYEGKVLDGRNRLLACKKLGNVLPRFEHYETETNGNAVQWVISQNVHRRNLTPSQKALIAVEAEDLMRSLTAEAKARQRMGSEQIPYPEKKGKTTEKAAQLFGTNEKYIRDVKRIKKEAPAMVEQLRSGAVSVPRALRQVECVEEAPKKRRKAAKSKRGESACYVSEDTIKRLIESLKNAPPSPALSRRGKVSATVIQGARELVSVGLRTLAAKRHPDHGGSQEEMQTLNASAEWVKLLIKRQENNQ